MKILLCVAVVAVSLFMAGCGSGTSSEEASEKETINLGGKEASVENLQRVIQNSRMSEEEAEVFIENVRRRNAEEIAAEESSP